LGKTVHELPYPPELAARFTEQIQQVFRTGRIIRDETAYTSPTGVTDIMNTF
jgi:hypothetical protein